MYLGMHSLIDVVAGIIFGVLLLALWLTVHEHVDGFITTGHNVTYFWASLSFLLCFAYPTPELPTPSFQYHTAFNGVAFGLVSGIQQTHLHSQPENIQILFSSELSIAVFLGRLSVGIPTILVTKICSKAVAQKLLPMVCNTLSIPIISSCYVPELKGRSKGKPSGHLARRVGFGRQEAYNVDTGIRFLQYAGLAWSAVVLVPAFFSLLRL
ncbi:lipid phosphate phosphatase delta-like [Zingiber officinale]|uniref:lipid phosphate phosphatase delta-like n=1 Tax=Zingiber officinale TaxID=94328 RepID=UPI001C4C035B|nr:lipid phosphate phosphatase delta-like [Zingiber officinale]